MRHRNIKKAVDDYKELRSVKGDVFGVTDLHQIYEMAKDSETGKIDIFTAIGLSLQAGYMVGYRSGVRAKG